MTLDDLPGLLGCRPAAAPGAPIAGVTEDSRRVKPGMVFVAAPGSHADGHVFAAQAVASGAIAILGDRTGIETLHGVPYLGVPHPRRALGVLAHALAGYPSRGMTVLGITGTNGKSSSAVMARRALEACGKRAAVFGTLGYEIDGAVLPAQHTTPFGEELAGIFRQARDLGQTHVVMEVSSHAIDQERIAGIEFDAVAFTNLTQDHLDYHGDMEEYRRAKVRLFERIEGPGRFTVVNVEDPSAPYFEAASRVPCYTYGDGGVCRAKEVRMGADRTVFRAATPWGGCEVSLALLGRHNVLNALCVLALCGGLGLPLEDAARGVGALARVPGRFERVDTGQDFQVIVDYAHTDDGLKNVLQAARELCSGRVIVVFGCGGDRDRTKRPKMGAAAGALSDLAIITSDNPRTEDPLAIIDAIEPGVRNAGKRKGIDYLVIPERAEAIRAAIRMAQPGDLVLIAGKGHEDYQILGTNRIHFDDREEARAALEEARG